MTNNQTAEIRRLNNCFRRSLVFGGQTVLTAGVSVLDAAAKTDVLRQVQTFEAFTPDNDPYGEHDGAIDMPANGSSGRSTTTT
ncbi:DUF3768 domain-containing protein [Bradyrhizobium canariense]|uniref:DUF3768 domain-containing protein n=1 Tax=Bradyrhizobium canariense TaxID=255045 RepID=UPI00308339DC